MGLALTAPKDTLRHQVFGRPMTIGRDASKVPCARVAEVIRKYREKDKRKTQNPETEALWFYMLNHAVAEVRNRKGMDEPLGDLVPILDLFHEELGPRAVRLFYYILLICVRETRHVKKNLDLVSNVVKKFGAKADEFNDLIKHLGSEGSVSKFLSDPPDMPLGKFVESMQYYFYNATFDNSFGGQAWGAVADVLVEFVNGRFTPEMMLDTGFTLAHNNGPIFNKGMFYGLYDPYSIRRILDVQRSGQIPQMIGNKEAGQYSTDNLYKAWTICHGLLGGDVFSGHVDWWVVESLGAIGSYPSEKKAQEIKHGKSMKWEMAVAKHEAKLSAKAEVENKTWLEIFPGQKILKLTREQAA